MLFDSARFLGGLVRVVAPDGSVWYVRPEHADTYRTMPNASNRALDRSTGGVLDLSSEVENNK